MSPVTANPTHPSTPPHTPQTPQPPDSYLNAGDLLEAEQGKAMALKRAVSDMERRVSELSGANAGLGRELAAARCGAAVGADGWGVVGAGGWGCS